MHRIPRLYGFLLLLSHGFGVPFCIPPSDDLGFTQLSTFCDSSFCVCNDPYGRVHCRCPPEVQVDEVVVKSRGSCAVPLETTALTIDNCENVTVIKEAFAELKELQSVTFANVRQLSVIGGAFRCKGPGLNVNFTNVTLPDLPSFSFAGNIDTVSFENSYIAMIRAFAFTNIESARKISFADSNIANVESQAFKKFPVSKFLVKNSRFNLIPSRFMFDVDVENLFKIDSTFVDVIRTAGFVLNSPKVTIVTGSVINTVGSEAFKIRTNGDVVMQHNKFNTIDREAFRGLFVERYVIQHAGKPKFRFLNNSLINYEEKTFVYNRTSFDAEFSKVKIEELCTCETLIKWRDMIHERHTTSEKTIEDDVEPFWCQSEDKHGGLEFVAGKEFYQSNCTTLTKSIFFFVVIITGTAISLVLIIIFIVCFFKRKRRWSLVPGCEKPKEVQLKSTGETKVSGAKAIIVPDGRTYRETEFHVIVEKAEPLEVGYVPCKVVRDRSRSQISSK